MNSKVIVSMVSVTAVFACLALAGQASAATKVVPQCNPHAAAKRPHSMILACGDAGIQAVRIHWSSWGGTKAHGKGRILIKTCKPDCASGGVSRRAGRITLSGRKHCHGRLREYSRATVKPRGGRSIKVSLPTCRMGGR